MIPADAGWCSRNELYSRIHFSKKVAGEDEICEQGLVLFSARYSSGDRVFPQAAKIIMRSKRVREPLGNSSAGGRDGVVADNLVQCGNGSDFLYEGVVGEFLAKPLRLLLPCRCGVALPQGV